MSLFSKVKFRRFKNYSGPIISGSSKLDINLVKTHWDRIVWLTSQVESGGKFGTVQSYDGAGMTAGITQAIAVYPRELAHEDNNPEDDQGVLWELLEAVREDSPELTKRIDDEFKEIGWVLYQGQVRYVNEDGTPGDLVHGRVLREELTPNQGIVPSSGEDWDTAKGWALLFHDVFSDPKSFPAQINFAETHLIKLARRKPRFLRGESVQSIVYNNDCRDTKLFSKEDPMDLAMATFFSNSVNAPALAFRLLERARILEKARNEHGTRPNWQDPIQRRNFAKTLICMLGTANYAKWNFKIVTGRYQRTRKAAMKIWPKHLFEGRTAVMPKQL
jgi:hypothetical protein